LQGRREVMEAIDSDLVLVWHEHWPIYWSVVWVGELARSSARSLLG